MSLVKYYALYTSDDGTTKGFRPLGEFGPGERPVLTANDVVGVSEAMLQKALNLLERHPDPHNYFVLEIEGSEGKTTGRISLSHVGLFLGPKGALEACKGRKHQFENHWLITLYRRPDIVKIFTKLENPSRNLH